jgi:hypothetical protein
MLIGENHKKLTGICILGDYYDLKSIVHTVDCISSASVSSHGENLLLSNFMNDMQQARDGLKIEKTYDVITNIPKVTYRGAVCLWPSFLFTIGLLRWGAGFIDTDKRIQADIFSLEHIARYCLKEADAEIGQKCIDCINMTPIVTSGYLFQFLIELDYLYVTHSKKAKQRFSYLPEILQMTVPISSEYKDFEAYAERVVRLKNREATDVEPRVPTMDRWGL